MYKWSPLIRGCGLSALVNVLLGLYENETDWHGVMEKYQHEVVRLAMKRRRSVAASIITGLHVTDKRQNKCDRQMYSPIYKDIRNVEATRRPSKNILQSAVRATHACTTLRRLRHTRKDLTGRRLQSGLLNTWVHVFGVSLELA